MSPVSVEVFAARGDGWHSMADGHVIGSPPAGLSRTLFGARCGPAFIPDTESEAQQRARVSAVFSSSGKLGVERWFNGVGEFGNWDVPTPAASTMILSVAADVGTTINGGNDANWLNLLKSLPVPTYVCPMAQEVDLGNKGVTATQCVQAVEHVKSLALANGISTHKYGAIVTSFKLQPAQNFDMTQWVSSNFDWIGVDCYANSGVPISNTLEKAWQLGIDFAASVNLPLIIPETSFGAGVPNGGQGFTDAQVTTMVTNIIQIAKNNSNIKAVSWFESNKSDGNWCIEPGIALIDGHNATALWKGAVDYSVSAWTSSPGSLV